MKLTDLGGALATAVVLLSAACEAKHGHNLHMLERRHAHHRHQDFHDDANINISESLSHDLVDDNDGELKVKKRSSQCAFPTDAGLVAVTPGSSNGGWAMSPDQSCTPGNYCPYACPPGQLSMQWDPTATSYTYPQSMNGGLYCDKNGNIQKPFPNKDYCTSGTGVLAAQNNCGQTVSFCQTVLPGNEAMLIPTAVDSYASLAVPGPSYWCSTAAHYYVNNPGCSTDDCCIWGDGSEPIGNWAPYVAGANTDSTGNTFVKIAWNPIYTDSNFASTKPSWGLEILCDGDGCNGLPCKIDPSVNDVNDVTSPDSATGAGGANFCVVTVPSGVTANIVVFNAGESSASASASQSSTQAASSTKTSAPPSTSSTAAPSTSSTAASSSASSSTSASSTEESSSATVTSSASSESSWAYSYSFSTSQSISTSNAPHVFIENSTTLAATSTGGVVSSIASATLTAATTAQTTSKHGAASSSSVSAGLLSLSVLAAFVGSLL